MIDATTTFRAAAAIPAARAILERYLPGYAASPMAAQLGALALGAIAHVIPTLRDDPAATARLWEELAQVDGGATRVHGPRIDPDPHYESADVPVASATVLAPASVGLWQTIEIVLHGPSHGNPFVDVELAARFERAGGELVLGGFYDGDGRYVLRVLADEAGEWSFTTRSTARSLDGVRGTVTVTDDPGDRHGPVRVDGFHFRHADGTRHRPWGTTAYAWTHQTDDVQERTLATLAASPFTKIRMCLFPKSYLFNTDDPESYAFPRRDDGAFDVERFDTAWFGDLERRIDQLAELGIEADLILFHPYDRWGFADLGPAVDERWVRYVVRRLASRANVWWSMANEYDLMSKSVEEWDRLGAIVASEDPHHHLLSIHNCLAFYDYTRPWITHASTQRIDVYRTAENTDAWREQWGKPVVIDECAYEGDIDQGWGNITGEEMTRRFWEGAVRGGYVGHGETYLNDREELWWSKGGELVGSSPARIAFLERVVADAPDGVLDPLPSDWDLPWGGAAGRYLLGYFGFNRPRYRNVFLPPGRFSVDVIDTWGMTIERMPEEHESQVRVELPGRQFMAIRLVRVSE